MAFDYDKFLENQKKAKTKYRKSQKQDGNPKKIFLDYSRKRKGDDSIIKNWFEQAKEDGNLHKLVVLDS